MIDRKKAEQIAQEFINSPNWNSTNDRFIILSDGTIEKDYGWVFFYNSERYIETGDHRFSLTGNVPIVIEKIDGSVNPLKPHPILEIALAEYEASRTARG